MTFVEGPGAPPIGDGSVRLHPQAFAGLLAEETQAVLRTLKYQGTRIDEMDTLSYSINRPNGGGGDSPTMQLAVSNVNNSANFTSLVFIPGANGNVAPADDTWTDYTPTSAGFFEATRDVLGPDNQTCLICGRGTEGDCVTTATCDAVREVTWAQILNAMPDAVLNDSGSFSFRIGREDTGAGHVTNVRFNDDIYFFEPDA